MIEPRPCAAKCERSGRDHVEEARGVDLQDLVPRRDVEIGEERTLSHDRGVVHEHVEMGKGLHRGRGDALGRVDVGEVRREMAHGAEGGELFGGLREPFAAPRAEEHGRALVEIGPRDPLADALARPRDESRFAFESLRHERRHSNPIPRAPYAGPRSRRGSSARSRPVRWRRARPPTAPTPRGRRGTRGSSPRPSRRRGPRRRAPSGP